MNAYGLKKPLEEKQAKIQQLHQQNMRYYPEDRHHKYDEWQAIIKHQAAQYEQHLQAEKDEVSNKKRMYAEQLQKDIELRQKQKELDNQMKNQEHNMMMAKQQEMDQMQHHMRNQELQLKNHLHDLNRRQMDEYNKRIAQEKVNEKALGQQLGQQAEEDLTKMRELERLKKMEYAGQLQFDIEQRNKLRQLEQMMNQKQQDDAKRMMMENGLKEVQREQDHRARFLRFDDDLKRKHEWYNRNVIDPKLRAQMDEQMKIQQKQQEQQRLEEEKAEQERLLRNQAIWQTSQQQRQQMEEKNKLRNLEGQMNTIDRDRFNRQVVDINMRQQEEADERKRKQQLYRDILAQQINYNKEMQGYGNMTDVEKKMNRDDLVAWKQYDNNQYSMIPGVNTVKRFKRDIPKKDRTMNAEEQQRRMQVFGYNRDVRFLDRAGSQNTQHRNQLATAGTMHLQTIGGQVAYGNGPASVNRSYDPSRNFTPGNGVQRNLDYGSVPNMKAGAAINMNSSNFK